MLLEVKRQGATIAKLGKWLWGARTERTDQVCPEPSPASELSPPGPDGDSGPQKQKKSRRKGESRGRNGREDLPAAQRVKVPIEGLRPGDPCPECPKGKVHPLREPKVLIRVKGMAPSNATV